MARVIHVRFLVNPVLHSPGSVTLMTTPVFETGARCASWRVATNSNSLDKVYLCEVATSASDEKDTKI